MTATTLIVSTLDVSDRYRALAQNLRDARDLRAQGGLHRVVEAELAEARASGMQLCLEGLGLFDPAVLEELMA